MATVDIRGATVSAADPPISTNPSPDLAWKAPCRLATTGSNLNLATFGLGTLDGVALASGDRVLVKDQTDATTNGLYNATTGAWTRTIDATNNSQFATGMLVSVTSGIVNAGINYKLTTASPITLGTSNLTFASQSTTLAALLIGNNLSDVANAATALSNLGGAPLASPAFTGNPTAATQTAGDSSSKLATTAFVQAASALSIPNATINLGSKGSASTPLINFFSSGNNVNYDSRLVATAGNTAQGGGTLVMDGTFEIVPQGGSLQTALQTAQSAHGSTGGTQLYNNLINISSDDAVCGTSAATSYSLGFYIQHVFGGANATGGREALFANLILNGAATNATNTVDFYVASSGQGQANVSDGGTLGVGAKGRMYGSNFLGVLNTGATGFKQCSASYDQIFLITGSSANIKIIGQFVYGNTDAVQGGTTDAAIGISAENGAAAGGKNGILIGDYLHTGTAPLATSGTIMATVGTATVANGIDFSSYTITGHTLNGGLGGDIRLNGSSSGSFTISPSSTGSPQYGGTATNDATPAGNIGEYISSSCPTSDTTATVTITIATPGVITWTGHPFLNSGIRQDAAPVVFTTSSALPTGLTAGTVYWVAPSSISGNNFSVATSVANAIAGTLVATSGSQSGTQTGTAGCNPANTTAKNITGIPLSAGDWEVGGVAHFTNTTAAAAVNYLEASLSTTADTLDTNPGKVGTMITLGSTPFNFSADRVTQAVGPFRFSLSGTTTVFLVGKGSFANALGIGGIIQARRRR